jgi:hypothetical protein
MLCHGGSSFALMGIAMAWLVVRRYPLRQFLVGAAATAFITYIPWSLYQKYGDPPGDRLLKWHLAGVIAPHPEAKLSDLLRRQYAALSGQEIARYKMSNVTLLAGDVTYSWRDAGTLARHLVDSRADARESAGDRLRRSMFLYWIPSIGFGALGPFALLMCVICKRTGPEVRAASTLWLCTALTLVVWCSLMFGPNGTLVHLGAYFTEIAAYTAATLAFSGLSKGIARSIVTLSVLFNGILFVWLRPLAQPGLATIMGPVRPALLAMVVLSAAAIFAVLLIPSSVLAAPHRLSRSTFILFPTST